MQLRKRAKQRFESMYQKVRAWQNIDNDVAKCQAGIGGHSNGERH